MKKQFWIIGLAILMAGEYSCKGKKDNNTPDESTTTTTAPPATTTAPVEVSSDDELRKGVADATKDYPSVNATVQDGVVTLTGSVERARMMNLKQSLDALHPKQIVNNLSLK